MKFRPFSRFAALLLAIYLTILPSAQALTTEQAAELLELLYIDEVPPAALEAETVKDMVAALGDPYTEYFTPEEYEAFLASMSDSSLVGIGVVFSRSGGPIGPEGLMIEQVLENSPASRGGLKVGDRILSVDGHALEPVDLDTAAEWIRGEEGTTVSITYIRDGELYSADLVRATVVVAATTTQLLDDHIGYINCTTFGNETAGHFKEGIETYGDQADLWVVDLRSNLGGSAEAATECAGYFAGRGYMSILRDGSDAYSAYYHEEDPLTLYPVIVLVDQYSASASEIFASAIQSYRSGIVVGTRTYGKGVAQIVADQDSMPDYFPEGDAIKITSYRFFSPDGNTTDQIGVLPHILLAPEDVGAALLLRSSPVPEAKATLRIDLSWRWYVDLDTALTEENQASLLALLNALPQGTKLYLSNDTSVENPVTVTELCELYSLSYHSSDFTDLSDSMFPDVLSVLKTYGILRGKREDKFYPCDSLTRAELCQLLSQALNLKPVSIDSPYIDVSPEEWFTPAVLAVTNLGLVNGVGDGRFDPHSPVSHEQLLTIMGRLARFLNIGFYNASAQMPEDALQAEALSAYADWSRSSAWLLACSQTTLFGTPRSLLWDDLDSISPSEAATRDETAFLLYELLSYTGILSV